MEFSITQILFAILFVILSVMIVRYRMKEFNSMQRLRDDGYERIFTGKQGQFIAFNLHSHRARLGSLRPYDFREVAIGDIRDREHEWDERDGQKTDHRFLFRIDIETPRHEVRCFSGSILRPDADEDWDVIQAIFYDAEQYSVRPDKLREANGDDTSSTEHDYDVFISHAWEDKKDFVRPLVEALKGKGLEVWYDEYSLKLGDSLRRSIDRGLAESRYGLVVLSHNFFSKEWPQQELDALSSTIKKDERRILPIWHGLTAEDVKIYSPLLSGLVAAKSSDGIPEVVKQVLEVCRPNN